MSRAELDFDTKQMASTFGSVVIVNTTNQPMRGKFMQRNAVMLMLDLPPTFWATRANRQVGKFTLDMPSNQWQSMWLHYTFDLFH